MQFIQLEKIIHSVKNRIKDNLLIRIRKRMNKSIMIFAATAIGMAGLVISILSLPPWPYILFLPVIVIPGLMVLYAIVHGIVDYVKLAKKINQHDFGYIIDIDKDFVDEQQKLNVDEIQELSVVNFDEDTASFLTDRIHDNGYLKHDDIYFIYKQLKADEKLAQEQITKEEQRNANFYKFLKDNDVEHRELEIIFRKMHLRSFNGKL